MEEQQTSLNPSSLLDLKAELHKRYESFRKAKVIQQSESGRQPTAFKIKGETISKEKKSLQTPIKSAEDTSEESLALKKSRLALEAKARLYEKITSNNELIDEEESERYLVDFNRKVLYESSTPVQSKEKNADSATSDPKDPVYSSSELKEIYERKTTDDDGKKTSENLEEDPIHYQNIRYNEVRDHGTGYFSFSMDESKRKEQMEELKNLRQQTGEQQLLSKNIVKKRRTMLEARLAKVCERRNIDISVVKTYTATGETDESKNEDQNIDLSSIPLPEPPTIPDKKEVKIRPWDVGKSEYPKFVPEKRKRVSQKDYVEERRSDRLQEFAPPTIYK